MHQKNSVLVMHKIRRQFVNTLTVDDKDYMVHRDNLAQQIRMQLSQKEKTFSEFFFAFLKSILNFKHLPKKDTLIAHVFPERLVSKNMFR